MSSEERTPGAIGPALSWGMFGPAMDYFVDAAQRSMLFSFRWRPSSNVSNLLMFLAQQNAPRIGPGRRLRSKGGSQPPRETERLPHQYCSA